MTGNGRMAGWIVVLAASVGVACGDDTSSHDAGTVACSTSSFPSTGDPCTEADRTEQIACRQCSCTSDCCAECTCGADHLWACTDHQVCRDFTLDGGTCDAGTVPRCGTSCAP
jgi:hypothetical protein